jgi:hypothetical protein
VPLVANGGNLLWLLNYSDDEVVVGTVTLAPLDVVLVEAM